MDGAQSGIQISAKSRLQKRFFSKKKWEANRTPFFFRRRFAIFRFKANSLRFAIFCEKAKKSENLFKNIFYYFYSRYKLKVTTLAAANEIRRKQGCKFARDFRLKRERSETEAKFKLEFDRFSPLFSLSL